MLNKRRNVFLFAAIVLFVAFLPYMNDFLILGHDLRFHLGRIEGLADSIRHGQLMGRINTSKEYGYISGIMYPQLLLYIPAICRLLGMSLIHSYKLLIFLINVISLLTMYFAVKNILGEEQKAAAWLAGACYTLSIYRLENIYLRASLGETIAMAFMPLLLWGMYELFFGASSRWRIAVWGWTGIIESHVIATELCLIITIIVFVVCAFRICRKRRLGDIIKAAIATVLLNLYFLLPFTEYFVSSDFHVFHEVNQLSDSGIYFSQLFFNNVKNTGIVQNPGSTAGELPLTIGLFGLGVILVYIWFRMNQFILRSTVGDSVFMCTLLILFMASWVFPWGFVQRIPIIGQALSSIQFLHRWLGLAMVFIAILLAIDISALTQHIKTAVVVPLMLCLIMANCWYYLGDTMESQTISEHEALTGTNIDNLYLYESYNSLDALIERGELIEAVTSDGQIAVSNVVRAGSALSFDVELNTGEAVDIEIPVYYYPDYAATVNGKQLEVQQGELGVLRICGISESGRVNVTFKERIEWKVAVFISTLTLLGMIIRKRGK